MSWVEAINEFTSGYNEGQAAAIGYVRGAAMWAAARAGASGASVLSQFVGTPLGIRRQDFYNVWRGMQAQLSGGAGLYAVPPEAAADQSLLPPAPADWTGQYTHQVELTYRTRTETGYEVHKTWRNVISPNILTPAEATQAALDIVATPTEAGTPSVVTPSNVVVAGLSGLWYRTMPGAGSMAGVVGI